MHVLFFFTFEKLEIAFYVVKWQESINTRCRLNLDELTLNEISALVSGQRRINPHRCHIYSILINKIQAAVVKQSLHG